MQWWESNWDQWYPRQVTYLTFLSIIFSSLFPYFLFLGICVTIYWRAIPSGSPVTFHVASPTSLSGKSLMFVFGNWAGYQDADDDLLSHSPGLSGYPFCTPLSHWRRYNSVPFWCRLNFYLEALSFSFRAKTGLPWESWEYPSLQSPGQTQWEVWKRTACCLLSPS